MAKEEKYFVQYDCFGYDAENQDCKALNKLYCKQEKCVFFKKKLDMYRRGARDKRKA